MLVLLASAKVPEPPGADQEPGPLAAALMLTALVPHEKYGPPALAVATRFTITWVLTLTGGQGPAGSMLVQVSVTGPFTSVAPGA